MYQLTGDQNVVVVVETGEVVPKGSSKWALYQEWMAAGGVALPVPSATVLQQEAAIKIAIQAQLDAVAQSHGYDNITSACSYSGYSNVFQAEAQALGAWRSQVWAQAYAYMAANPNNLPTPAAAVAMMPAYAGGVQGAPA